MFFLTLFGVCAPILSAALWLTAFLLGCKASALWILPIALLLFCCFMLVYAVCISIPSFFVRKEMPKKISPFHKFISVQTLQIVLAFTHTRIRLKGKELLPNEPFILVSNHRSAIDALASFAAFSKHKFAFIAKAPVIEYPIIGPYISKCGVLGIERDKPLQSLRVINHAAKLIKEQGMSFGIYPEGTRTKTGRVGPFKSGAFLAAKKANVPVVVITTEGTETFWKRIPFGRPRITLTVRAIISAEEVSLSTPEELAEKAREQIVNALGEGNAEQSIQA